MRMKNLLLIIAFIILTQAASGSSGIGVGVNPDKMNFKLAPGMSEEQSLYVINTGSETATYGIFLDDSIYEDWFTFSSSSFDLKAGENKKVKIKLSVPESVEDNVECKLKVPCTVSGSAIGTGIIIPVHIDISAPEEDSLKAVSLRDSSSGGMKGSLKSFIDKEIKEVSQQFAVKNNSFVDLTQNITYAEEKLKGSAENLKVIVIRSFEDSTTRLDDVIKKIDYMIKRFDEIINKFYELKEMF